VYRKVPGLGQKRNAGLTYSILAIISFKIVSLGTYTAIPSFSPRFKSTMEVIFLNAVEFCLRFPLDVKTLFQNVIPSVSFSIWETKQNHRGPNPASRGMGNDSHVVVSHKLCGFQGRGRACCRDGAMQHMFKFSVTISWQTP
jgi:hypothetical protein